MDAKVLTGKGRHRRSTWSGVR